MKEVLTFERCDCVITVQFTHRQSTMIDEKQSRRSIAMREIAASLQDEQTDSSNSTNTDKSKSSQKIRISEETHASFENLENVNTTKRTTHVSHIYKK